MLAGMADEGNVSEAGARRQHVSPAQLEHRRPIKPIRHLTSQGKGETFTNLAAG